jgi:hypothetical protein
MRLPGDLPEVEHGDIPSDLHAVGILIGEQIQRITSLIHYADAVPAGSQWTIPFGLDCGYDGELVIRVRATGDCERRPATASGGRR